MLRRTVALVVAFIAAFFALPSADASPLDATKQSLLYVYVYVCASPDYDLPTNYTAPERGPQAQHAEAHVSTGQRAADRGSQRALVRRIPAGAKVFHHYDDHVRSAQVVTSTVTTLGRPGQAVGGLSSRQRTQVATKSAPELASGMERTGSALTKSDPFHRSVSWVVDNPAARRFRIKGGDGVRRDLHQLPGEVNGKSGVFEWIIDRSGTNPAINHQRFIPGDSVTGFPNQVAP